MSGDAAEAGRVAAARAGSDAAFSRLVDRHQQALRAFLRKACANADEAEDIAQEAFLAAWTRLRLLKSDAVFKSWLFGIAWRKARDRTRSAARSRRRETEWAGERPEEVAPREEMRLTMKDALARLPDEQRAALALCLAGGCSHGEAAEILALPLGTVKSHINRGRARLAEYLSGDDDA